MCTGRAANNIISPRADLKSVLSHGKTPFSFHSKCGRRGARRRGVNTHPAGPARPGPFPTPPCLEACTKNLRQAAGMSNAGDSSPIVFKILVVGCGAAGKSSLIKKYVYGVFTPDYKATIGVDFAFKLLTIRESELREALPSSGDKYIRLQLWDIAGQERFGNLTRAYYKDANGALVVGDIESPTFEEDIAIWKRDIDNKVYFPGSMEPIPCVMCCHKIDKPRARELYDEEAMKGLSERMGFVGFKATSALTGENLEEAAKLLCIEILKRRSVLGPQQQQQPQVLAMQDEPEESRKKSKCC